LYEIDFTTFYLTKKTVNSTFPQLSNTK